MDDVYLRYLRPPRRRSFAVSSPNDKEKQKAKDKDKSQPLQGLYLRFLVAAVHVLLHVMLFSCLRANVGTIALPPKRASVGKGVTFDLSNNAAAKDSNSSKRSRHSLRTSLPFKAVLPAVQETSKDGREDSKSESHSGKHKPQSSISIVSTVEESQLEESKTDETETETKEMKADSKRSTNSSGNSSAKDVEALRNLPGVSSEPLARTGHGTKRNARRMTALAGSTAAKPVSLPCVF